MLRLFPVYEREDLLVRLFERGVRDQWSPEEVDWEAPLGLRPRQAEALTRILSPVYLGEQSAMFGAASVLPQLAAAGETPAQLYLSTFLLDEARHFHVLTDLFRRLGHHPIALRELPEMLRYHHRLRQGDRLDWAWGILISDLFARQFYQAFAKVQPQALFGKLSARVLIDESRHQAFAHTYLKRAAPHLPAERVRALRVRQDELLAIMGAMNRRLRPDAEELGLDGRAFLEELQAQVEAHARSIGLAARGEDYDEPPGPGGWTRLVAGLRAAGDGVRWPARAPEPDSPEAAQGEVTAPDGAVTAGGGRDDAAVEPSEARAAAGRRSFHYFLRDLARGCTGCAVALLCRSRAAVAATRA